VKEMHKSSEQVGLPAMYTDKSVQGVDKSDSDTGKSKTDPISVVGRLELSASVNRRAQPVFGPNRPINRWIRPISRGGQWI
jgi:hypothetical protein